MVEEMILPVALEGVELGDDVIEIGPGPGFTTDVLRQRTAVLTAVEINPVLAESLRTRLDGTNVEVVLGDATPLSLPSDRFTGAAAFNMVHHIATVEAQQAAFSELARVLKAGATLVASDAGYSEGVHHFHEADIYNPIEVDALPERLAEVGFTEVTVRQYELGWVCTARAA